VGNGGNFDVCLSIEAASFNGGNFDVCMSIEAASFNASPWALSLCWKDFTFIREKSE
jgi:hypothetical protein